MMYMISEEFQKNGFVLLKRVIPHPRIDEFLKNHLEIVNEITGLNIDDPQSPDLIKFYNQHRELEAKVYEQTLCQPWLLDFSKQQAIVEPIKKILGENVGLFKKCPFRMDLPLWTQELAHWHQDHFYVKGNTKIIVAWIPMQDTSYLNGCLSIMPRTHQLGPIAHDLQLGKKSIPSSIFGNEIRLAEMNKGDLLLFSTLLLHSSNVNYSTTIRYALQPRFTLLNEPVSEGMGGTISV